MSTQVKTPPIHAQNVPRRFTEHRYRMRPMVEADLATVINIEQRAYEFPWTLCIFEDCLRVGYCCWVCEEDNRIKGYGVMSVAVGEAHVLNLCVAPEFHGQGVGRRVLTYLLHLAQRHGADVAFLEARPSNQVAIHLYQQMGFCEVAIRRNYYPDHNGREDALVLALSF